MNELRQNDEEGLVTTERVAIVLWRFVNGERLTTSQVADLIDIETESARKMMTKISRKWPITQIDGVWELIR